MFSVHLPASGILGGLLERGSAMFFVVYVLARLLVWMLIGLFWVVAAGVMLLWWLLCGLGVLVAAMFRVLIVPLVAAVWVWWREYRAVHGPSSGQATWFSGR